MRAVRFVVLAIERRREHDVELTAAARDAQDVIELRRLEAEAMLEQFPDALGRRSARAGGAEGVLEGLGQGVILLGRDRLEAGAAAGRRELAEMRLDHFSFRHSRGG